MKAPALLALAFALALALVAPTATAANGVTLTASGSPPSPQEVAPDATVTVNTAFGLDLTFAQAQTLRVSSAVRTGSECPCFDHSAAWTFPTELMTSSRASSATSTQGYDAGHYPISVQWSLPSSVPAGTYTLYVLVEAVPSGNQGGSAVTQFDGASFPFQLTRSSGSTGGGGGSGGGTPASNPTSTPSAEPSATSSSSSSSAAPSVAPSQPAKVPGEEREPADSDLVAAIKETAEGTSALADS